jgi:HSP20 family molecular chaperone IbpA
MVAKSSGVRKAKEPVAQANPEIEAIVSRMKELHESIASRAYEIFETEHRIVGHELEHWLRAERELLHPVHLSLIETDQTIEVRAEVPGFSDSEIKVVVQPRSLTITGKREVEKKEQKGRTIYSDECASEMFRVLDLPTEVNGSKMTTKLKNGVLTLSIPKIEKVKSIRQAKAA